MKQTRLVVCFIIRGSCCSIHHGKTKQSSGLYFRANADGEAEPKSPMFNDVSASFFSTEMLLKPKWFNLIILLDRNRYFISIFLPGFSCLMTRTWPCQTPRWMPLFSGRNFNNPPSALRAPNYASELVTLNLCCHGDKLVMHYGLSLKFYTPT